MALWNSNDAESSKPSWLTEDQKRNCFRTIRGWEIPLVGCGYTGTTSNGFQQEYVTRSGVAVVPTELLVCLPLDPSVTGVTQTNYAARGFTSVPGSTFGDNVNNPNYAPYITSPSTGQNIRVTLGVTAYIPIIASDCNLTDLPQSLGLTFSTVYNAGFSFLVGATSGPILSGGFTAPSGVTGRTGSIFEYGGWGGITAGSACLICKTSLTAGTYGCTATVFDGRGLTGNLKFNVVVS